MKICHIMETGGGGSARTSLFLITDQIAKGHQVTLVTSPLRAENWFLKAIKDISGLRIYSLAMRRAVGVHDVVAWWRLIGLLRRYGPFDIIHSHSSKAGGLARLAGIFFHAKQIYTPHAFVTLDSAAKRIYGVMEFALSWLSDAIIAVSSAEAEHGRRVLHISSRKIHTICNGVVIEYPAGAQKARYLLQAKQNDFIIGWVGRMSAQKRPQRALAAFALVAKDHPQARLAMIGDQGVQDELAPQITALNLQNRVVFLTGHDARDFMPGFDVLLCSSDYEGFANVFLEALAAGVPIVTTPVGGAVEAVIEGQTGFISHDFSASDLAAHVSQIMAADPAQRDTWAQAALRRAQNFSEQKMASETLALYEKALGRLAQEAKPRVAYIINSLTPAGAEIGLLTLVREGFFKDFDVHIVALAQGEPSLRESLSDLLGQDRVICLSRNAQVHDAKLPLYCLLLLRQIGRLRPDILILSLPQAIICGRVAGWFAPRCKTVIFEHNTQRNRRMADFLLRLTSGATDMIFGDADVTLQASRALYRKNYPVCEVPLMILPPHQPRVWSRPKTFKMLSLGRLVEQKNYAELLRATAILLNNGYPATLRIAGAGPLQSELLKLADELGIAAQVQLLGFIKDTAPLLADSHIYIQPSLREGVALSVLEAMAAGLVVVASDVGGVKDYGHDDVNMYKIPLPPNAKTIAENLSKAIDLYDQLQPMSVAAQQVTQQFYSQQAVWEKWRSAQNALHNIVN